VPGAAARPDESVPSPEKSQRWHAGIQALGALSERSHKDPYDETELRDALAGIKKQHGFTVLEAELVEDKWQITAGMSPKTKNVPKIDADKTGGVTKKAHPWRGLIGRHAFDDLSSAALDARGPLGYARYHNVAVAEIQGAVTGVKGNHVVKTSPSGGVRTLIVGWSQEGGLHSEVDILDRLAGKVDLARITAFYSERQPCSACEARLAPVRAQGTPVYWSVPYSDVPEINRGTGRLLAGMIEGIVGLPRQEHRGGWRR
jgi:hypothetical protein